MNSSITPIFSQKLANKTLQGEGIPASNFTYRDLLPGRKYAGVYKRLSGRVVNELYGNNGKDKNKSIKNITNKTK